MKQLSVNEFSIGEDDNTISTLTDSSMDTFSDESDAATLHSSGKLRRSDSMKRDLLGSPQMGKSRGRLAVWWEAKKKDK